MDQVLGFLGIAALAGLAYWFWSWRRRQAERLRASEERLATFMAQAMAAAKPAAAAAPGGMAASAPKPVDPAQRLLFDAAAKAGEANEPVLAIQLYARLLSRFPDSAFAGQARAAVEAQKKRLAKA